MNPYAVGQLWKKGASVGLYLLLAPLGRGEDVDKGERTDLLPPPPPPEVLADWQKRHAAYHFQANSAGGAS